jgi:CheY-like chemotaxis protein
MKGIPFSILIVEDDADDRLFIDQAFKEIGFEAEIKKFINGEYLFKYLDKIESSMYPGLIVLDTTLPKMNVTEIFTALKSHEAYRHIPVVIYTAHISPHKKEELFSLGAKAVFEKEPYMSSIVDIARELKALALANNPKNLTEN